MTSNRTRTVGLLLTFTLLTVGGVYASRGRKNPAVSFSPPNRHAPTTLDSTPTANVTQLAFEPQPSAAPTMAPYVDGTVSGRVVDEHNRPLGTATVTLYSTGVLQALRQTRTTSDGAFELLGLPIAQTFQLSAEASGFRTKRIEVRLDQPGAALERTLTLRTGQTLTGHVVDNTGNPVVGAHVDSSDDASPSASSDETGSFALQGLPNEPVNVFVRAEGFATLHLRHVTPGQNALKLTLERPAVVQGKVQIPNTVAEILVSACHFDDAFKKELCVARQLLRQPNDQYRLEGLPSGRYDLVVSAAGYPEKRHAFVALAGQDLTGPTLDPAR